MGRTFVWHPSKGPKTTPKQNLPETGNVRIKQVRSGIGHSWRMRLVLKSLGLRHHQASVIHNDTAALRGQVNKVRHLVTVSAVKE